MTGGKDNIMASAQEDGRVEIWAVRIDGLRKRVASGNISVFAPQGGAADGALSSVLSPDELVFQPEAGPMLRRDDHIEVVFVAAGADGIDVSDSIWQIPVTEYDRNGKRVSVKWLAQSDFSDPTPADYTTVANIPTVVGAYRVVEGGLRFGGGHIFLDIQDDTA